MTFKKFFIAFLLLSVILPIYHARGAVESDLGSIQNIQKIIKEKTPNFIAKPIIYVVNKIDGFRESIKIKIEERKAKTEGELNAPKEPGESDGKMSEFFKAFKYLELFILILLLFIFSIKLLYYAFVVFVILLILRFFWFRIY
ncbi:MAG: hypothetical protein AAB943_00730 [Patescibacteria group bacterium]